MSRVERVLGGHDRTYQMEKRYLHKDGHAVWVMLAVSLVQDAAGKPLHFVAQVQDVTARKRGEEALRQATAAAEDNVVNQRVVVRLLEKYGHAVTLAADGRQAVAAHVKVAFDLVLMDVSMPEMDGFEATQVIREREAGTDRRTPIVAMTAHAMKGDRERCLAAGMDDYVSKPVERAELTRVLAWAAGAPVVPDPEPVVERGPALDYRAALQRFGGDEELFADVAGVFRADAPRLLGELRHAVAAGDAPAVQRTAHGLKGAAG